MNVSLTSELEKFVQEQVDSKLYQTASEVVREALRLMKQRTERVAEHELLRAEIRKGLEAIERGEYIELTEANSKALLEDIKARGRARLAAKRKAGKR